MAKIVITTTDSETKAREMAKTIVSRKKAACVSIVGNVLSTYMWNEKMEEDAEMMLLCKVSDSVSTELIDLIKKIHNYDVPEVLEINVVGGSKEYLSWIEASCTDS